MVTYKFNQPYYEIDFSELDKQVHVSSFEAEERISELFEYRVKLISDDPSLNTSKILNKPATFIFNRGDDDPVRVTGIISSFEQYGRTKDYVFYKAVLVPRLWRLNLVYQNEIYQDMDIKKLIETVLDDVGLTGQDYKIDLKSNYPKHEYIVQYQETDLNFLNRRLEHFGIYYYFLHEGDKDIVVFTDSNGKLPSIAEEGINYDLNKDPFGQKEAIHEIFCNEKIVTGSVQVKDYNYMFPEKQLMAQSQLDDRYPGLYYDFGDHFENETEAEFLAKVRNQEFLAESKVFYGKSDCRLMTAGRKFTFSGHYREDWNGDYIITSVVHKGNQENLFALLTRTSTKTLTYENNFQCIPYEIEFRPKRKTPVPKVSGIMSAKIESGSGDEYAFIDDYGRYKVKMLFDLSDRTNGEASLPIRLTQNYSGANYGVHFPNRANAELLFACVDGNPDRPIGIGTVPNPSQATPVVSKNKTQNIIRTAAGNEFILDDKSKESQIILSTTDGNKFIFDDKDDKIEILSKDKHKILLDDKNKGIIIQSKDNYKIQLHDEGESISMWSKKEHYIGIGDKDGDEWIFIADAKDENKILIDITNNKIVIEAPNGDLDLLAKNQINIKSKTLNIETESDTNFKSGNIKTEVDQDYELKASGIKQEAKMDFKMKGMNIEAKGDMNAKLEGGMNADLKAGMNAKLEGGLAADVKGGAQASVKGAVVMIN